MKLSQMIVQALDEKASPVQQLPHITPDMLRYFTTRKVYISASVLFW
jgi:translocation protein SEC63